MGSSNHKDTDEHKEKKREEEKKGIGRRFKSFWLHRIRRHWYEFLIALIFLGASGGIHWAWLPYNFLFMERDPHLSYPYYEDTTTLLPIAWIIFLAIFVPIAIFLTFQLVIRYLIRPAKINPKAIDPFLGFLCMFEGYSFTSFFSEFLKSYSGRRRPNFFAMCNYAGYRDALATKNYTYYLANTDPNVFGDMNKCLDQDPWIIQQSISSYPSGHAAFAFCGFINLALLVGYVWHCHNRKHSFLKLAVLALAFLIALLLSWSRTRDYWHSWDDIMAGAIIGTVIGFAVFIINFAPSSLGERMQDFTQEDKPQDRFKKPTVATVVPQVGDDSDSDYESDIEKGRKKGKENH